MSARLFVSALFLSVIAFAPQIASAQYGLYSSANSEAYGEIYINQPPYYQFVNDPRSASQSGAVGPVSSKTISSAGIGYTVGSGGAYSVANYGNLHAEATGGGNSGAGDGSATARWFDTITVTSTNLPPGYVKCFL